MAEPPLKRGISKPIHPPSLARGALAKLPREPKLQIVTHKERNMNAEQPRDEDPDAEHREQVADMVLALASAFAALYEHDGGDLPKDGRVLDLTVQLAAGYLAGRRGNR